jgi:hypothetical protein
MADNNAKSVDATRDGNRDQVTGPLARWIVGGGLIYLGIISTIALLGTLFVSKDEQAVIASQWKDILTFTLPVLGAWVGTVLAFFFSRENFEAANRNVQTMVNQLSARDRLAGISAKAVMIPRASIVHIKLSPGNTEAQVDLRQNVMNHFNDTITRLPVFVDTDAVKYVIHESTANKFLLKQLSPNSQAQPTLQDLVSDPAGKVIAALAFVAESASLAEAQDAMRKVDRCQDIFVTRTGQSGEAVLGWITNAEIAKNVEPANYGG